MDNPLLVRAVNGNVLIEILDWAKNPARLKAPIVAILESRINACRRDGKVPVVVADVDDTILRQSPYNEDQFVREPLGAWLFDWCLSRGMHGHIITARPGTPDAKAFLLQQLRRVGIRDPPAEAEGEEEGDRVRVPIGTKPATPNPHAIKVYMRPRKSHDISDAKNNARKLFDANERIVVTLGDQLGDHMHLTGNDGNDAERCEERFNPCTYYLFCRGEPTESSVLCVKTPELLGNWPHEADQQPHPREPSSRWAP